VAHPFWQLTIQPLPIPEEPMLAAFIAKHNLAPSVEDKQAAKVSGWALLLLGGGSWVLPARSR
jgi:hypothetical protein